LGYIDYQSVPLDNLSEKTVIPIMNNEQKKAWEVTHSEKGPTWDYSRPASTG
jgi:hypothetical protein